MQNIAVAITGASGSIYAKTLLDRIVSIRDQVDRVAVVMTDNAKLVWEYELGNKEYENYEFEFFANNDYFAPIASGSAQFKTLIVVPCSMGTLGRIANGTSNNLITRAADVVLKERRKLILVARDTPYSLIHLKNMEAITLAGGIICPATPSFYSRPQTFEDLARTVTDRAIDLAGLEITSYRWGKTKGE